MKNIFVLLLSFFLFACTSNPLQSPSPPPNSPTLNSRVVASTPLPATPRASTPAPSPTAEATPTATIFPTPFADSLNIAPREDVHTACEFGSPFQLPSKGVQQLAFVATGDCQNGEIGLFEIGDDTRSPTPRLDSHMGDRASRDYIAQSGLFGAAFTLTDVTNPSAPQVIGVWNWLPQGNTLDIKPFRQGNRYYLAFGLQRNRRAPTLPCGVAIVEVTNVRQPKYITRIDGRNASAPEPWCNVHTLEIDTDENGNANYFIVSDVDTFSARAVDVRDLQHPREVNFYHLHAHPHAVPNQPVLNYVHDSYVGDDKIYLANWLAGVVILDKQKFETGQPQDALIVLPTDNVAPGGFHVHFVAPIANGDFIFIQDELNADNGIRLLDIRDPKHPKTVWTETNPGGVNAPHNFVVKESTLPNENFLFVGWYNDGVRVFRFDVSDADKPSVTAIGLQEVRSNKNVDRERYFDGVWGVRVRECDVKGKKTICIYASDMSAGLIVLALP